jgi:hypothetical protein
METQQLKILELRFPERKEVNSQSSKEKQLGTPFAKERPFSNREFQFLKRRYIFCARFLKGGVSHHE